MERALRDRIEGSLADLAAARQVIGSQDLGLVRQRVRTDFEERIAGLEKALKWRLQSDNLPTRDAWAAFDDDRRRCARLLDEVLAFVQGMLLRSHGVDRNLCAVADALLEELNDRSRLGWRSFSLLADGESFASLAELVRLRFPVTGVWDLPIAAHEFGHFASTRLQPRDPELAYYKSFAAYVDDDEARANEEKRPWGDREKAFLKEFFADAFGTFALGPAYVRTCLQLRFSPVAGNDESDGVHPSFVRRAYLILKIFDVMAEKMPDYRSVRALCRDEWAQCCAAAGRQAIDTDKPLDAMARGMVHLLRDCVPHVEYVSWPVARALSASMFGRAGVIDPAATISDVLNACWIARMSAAPEWPPERISARILETYGGAAGAGR